MSVLEQAELYSLIDTAIRDHVRSAFGQSELDNPSWSIPHLMDAIMGVVGPMAEQELLLVKSNYHLINLLNKVEELTENEDDTAQNYLLNNDEDFSQAFAFQRLLNTALDE
jgi:hypothetical protein